VVLILVFFLLIFFLKKLCPATAAKVWLDFSSLFWPFFLVPNSLP